MKRDKTQYIAYHMPIYGYYVCILLAFALFSAPSYADTLYHKVNVSNAQIHFLPAPGTKIDLHQGQVFRVDITNVDSFDVILMLHLFNNQLDTVQFHQWEAGMPGLHILTGDRLRFHSRPVPWGGFYFPIDIVPGQTKRVWLKFTDNDPAEHSRIELIAAKQGVVQQGRRQIFISLFIGVMLMAVVSNVFLGITQRKWLYLKYALYIIGCNLYMLYDEGFLFQYLLPTSPVFNENLFYPTSYISLVLTCVFIREYLKQESKTQGLQKLILVFQYITFLMALGYLIAPFSHPHSAYDFYSKIVLYLFIGIVSLLIAANLLIEAYLGNRFAKVYLLSSMALSGSITYLIANFIGLVDDHQGRITFIYIGLLVEFVTLTFFLIYDYNKVLKTETQLTLALAKTEAQKAADIATAQQEERTQIALELHNGIAGRITALQVFVNSRLVKNKPLPETEAAYLQTIEKELALLVAETRNTSHQLANLSIAKASLTELLNQYLDVLRESNTLAINVIVSPDADALPASLQKMIFRTLSELIQNVLKHAKATQLTVQVICHPESVIATVEDDGIGLDTNHYTPGLGYTSIKEELKLHRGELFLDSSPQGTTASIEIATL